MNFEGIDLSKLPPPIPSPITPPHLPTWYSDKVLEWADGTIHNEFDKPIFFVRPEHQLERLSTCNKCDAYDKVNDLCQKCMCIMKTKSKMPDARCPINKW